MLRAEFESLPCEIILNILTGSPDLASLCNLLHASPVAFRAFSNNRPVHTIERVLSSGYTCQQVQFIVRRCAFLRSGKAPPWNYYDLMGQMFTQPSQVCDEQEPVLQDLDMDLDTIHSLLTTARDITEAALACLDDCLTQFYSLESRPKTMSTVEVGDSRPPPTWTEEQRAMRAVWLLQLARDSIDSNWDQGNDWKWAYVKCVIHLPMYECNGSRNANEVCYRNPSDTEFAMYEPKLPSCSGNKPPIPNPEYQAMVSFVEYIGRRFGQGNAERLACNDVSISELLGRRHLASCETICHFNNQSTPHRTVRECWACLPTETDAILLPSAAATRTLSDNLDEMYKCGYAFWSDARLQAHSCLQLDAKPLLHSRS